MSQTEQACTFYLNERLYALDVQKVQEITNTLPVTPIPLAPKYVKGLINLRGQIAVSIDLRVLFGLPLQDDQSTNNIVCRADGILLAFPVDRVGEVVENNSQFYEHTPETVVPQIAQFMKGVYKLEKTLMSMLDIDIIIKSLNKNADNSTSDAA